VRVVRPQGVDRTVKRRRDRETGFRQASKAGRILEVEKGAGPLPRGPGLAGERRIRDLLRAQDLDDRMAAEELLDPGSVALAKDHGQTAP